MDTPPVLLSLSPSSILSQIKEALGCGLVAVVLSTTVYGITVLQAYIYFRGSGQDSVRLRAFVAFLFILDTASLALAVDALWEYVVTDFGETWLLLKLPRALAFENAITYFIATLTQLFFARHLWALSKGNVPLVSAIIILALASLGLGIVVCIRNYTEPDFFSLAKPEMLWLVGAANGLSVPCDVTITIGLSYYLNSKRTGFKRTDSIINRLIIYAVNRGALTTMCQAGLTIVFVTFPGRLFHFPFDLLSGKLYCNTLLATLNAQKAMRMDGDSVVQTSSFVLDPRRMNSSTAGDRSGLTTLTLLDRMAARGSSTSTHAMDISIGNLKIMDLAHTRSDDGDSQGVALSV